MTLPHKLYPEKYDTCPKCGHVKHKQALLCVDCRYPRLTLEQPCDPLTRLIPLTVGKIVMISAHRYETLAAFRWHTFSAQRGDKKYFYAARMLRVNGKQHSILMHRQILGLDLGDPLEGDHINGDTLDNRDNNLRIATVQQQQFNTGLAANNTSGVKGVYWHKRAQKWQAHIWFNGKEIYLGSFVILEDAKNAYWNAALKYFGDFARPLPMPSDEQK